MMADFLPDYRWDFPEPASHFVRGAEPAKKEQELICQ